MKAMKTYTTKPSHVESRWYVFDAADKVLGRLATEVSGLLQGKHKPIYARHIITGDYVVVVNASKVKVTGNKLEQKLYRRHSDYPGGLREIPMATVREKYPDRIIKAAVRGMLPKTILGRQMLKRLKIYAGDSHPHGAQIKDMASEEIIVVPVASDMPFLSDGASLAEQSIVESAEDIVESAEDTVEFAEDTVESAEDTVESAEDTVESAEDTVESADQSEEELIEGSTDNKAEN